MSLITLRVANLHCAGCACNIEEKLLNISGVNTVSVDLPERQVTIEHDGTTVEEVVLQTLDRMGYPKLGDKSLLKQAKSYVSCAIGRLK